MLAPPILYRLTPSWGVIIYQRNIILDVRVCNLSKEETKFQHHEFFQAARARQSQPQMKSTPPSGVM